MVRQTVAVSDLWVEAQCRGGRRRGRPNSCPVLCWILEMWTPGHRANWSTQRILGWVTCRADAFLATIVPL